jgi:hypothetical protein
MLSVKRLSRRELLRLFSAAGLAGLIPAMGEAQDAASLSVLSQHDAERLLAVTRTLFPHDFLDDDSYTRVVATIDSRAAADETAAAAIQAGLADLPDGFGALTEEQREAHLRELEGSPFFRIAYDETLSGLYRDPDIARMLGNEGSSMEFGGFIKRGFDDIDWLPVDHP